MFSLSAPLCRIASCVCRVLSVGQEGDTMRAGEAVEQ